jgi:tetratricopeptide (TPR) repeat protein
LGQREEAVAHYWGLLRLNPSDNQGIRDILMPCLIELGRDKEAEKLWKSYEEDCFAIWIYSRALLDFRTHGESPEAKKSLRAAFRQNKHVPAYLLGDKKAPRSLPEYYSFGDENEAVLFTYGNRAAWEATPGAMDWLAAHFV